MNWLYDRYVIEAGDVAAYFSSRGYSTMRRKWETLPGISFASAGGNVPRYRVRAVDVRVYHTAGGLASGVSLWAAIIVDPLHSWLVMPLIEDVQGSSHWCYWRGDEPMRAGIVWRIAKGGLVVGDYVDTAVMYED